MVSKHTNCVHTNAVRCGPLLQWYTYCRCTLFVSLFVGVCSLSHALTDTHTHTTCFYKVMESLYPSLPPLFFFLKFTSLGWMLTCGWLQWRGWGGWMNPPVYHSQHVSLFYRQSVGEFKLTPLGLWLWVSIVRPEEIWYLSFFSFMLLTTFSISVLHYSLLIWAC